MRMSGKSPRSPVPVAKFMSKKKCAVDGGLIASERTI